ncbi:hypothetical protein [Rhizobium rhizogenes]|uniref:Uncharacterized protein n=1 Tax=Rhizobium rhizogenes (strain K84 / ATCC BAA-868) TaxID=311403 RepID=B9JMG3_RHIR8|nr:hypothetical protein [Rhizobium rhizogenes]ACM28551.1 hypothetical protein Arad_10002 [Rhizobium rhizogenes K84]MDJ1637044.1 hypothetical protein [Rhizobium rhizogenes]NTI45891.1 hypothetical protein [Rhizobium rhizogenes]OCJ22259.1 hypothetical protein A6U88_29940 [Agrobacterium sp. B131/95]
MIRLSARKLPRALLSLIIVSLLALNISLFRSDIDITALASNASVPVAMDSTAVAGDVILPNGPAFSQTLSRPLFSPTRREFVVQEKPAQQQDKASVDKGAATVTRPAIAFQGTRTIEGERRALVRLDGSQAAEWLPVGTKIAGWTITKIGADNLTLTQKDETASYDLFAAGGSGQTAPGEVDE